VTQPVPDRLSNEYFSYVDDMVMRAPVSWFDGSLFARELAGIRSSETVLESLGNNQEIAARQEETIKRHVISLREKCSEVLQQNRPDTQRTANLLSKTISEFIIDVDHTDPELLQLKREYLDLAADDLEDVIKDGETEEEAIVRDSKETLTEFLQQYEDTRSDILARLSGEALRRIAFRYEQKAKEIERTEEEKLDKARDAVNKKLLAAIQDNTIPVSEDLLGRVNEIVTISFVDPSRAELEEMGGAYKPDLKTILLSFALDQDEMEVVLMHEMLHALAGITLEPDDDEGNWAGFKETRNGLRRDLKSVSLLWFDEATTELLTSRLMSCETSSYKQEREFLVDIMEGIDEELLIGAYFENNSYPEERLKWQELNRAIDEKYRVEGVLEKVDGYVGEHGVTEMLKIWKEDPLKVIQ
jgi:hypothetical protein